MKRRLGGRPLEDDAARIKTWISAEPSGAGPAPNDAQYLTLAVHGDLTSERVFTPGDGLTGTDGGAGGTYELAVDVTDFIDTAYGLTEDTNNIRVAITANEGLDFNVGTGALEVDVTDFIDTAYGLTEDTNNIRINAGNGLAFDTGALVVDLVAAWSGLEFSGGDLRVDLDAEFVWTALHTFTATPAIEIDVASGDPVIVLDTQGADRFTVGVDDDDGDKFKINSGGSLADPSDFELDSSGNVEIGGSFSLPQYLIHVGDADTYLNFQDDRITLRAGGVDMIDVVEAGSDYVNFGAGLVFVNETANTDMAQGLTLNQGANDDHIFDIKSSDVAQPFTDYAESDTYGSMEKAEAAVGGLVMTGYKESGGSYSSLALILRGLLGENADTGKINTSRGIVEVYAGITDGSGGITSINADGNLLTIRNTFDTRFIFDAEGSAHADVEWVAFQEEDDRVVLADLEAALIHKGEPDFSDFSMYDRRALEELGLIHCDEEAGTMLNTTRLSMLLVGALRQAHERVDVLDARLEVMG